MKASECAHPVGDIPGTTADAGDWNEKLLAFIAKVDDFNVRGQRDQINHPGYVHEFKFCPLCGACIDRERLDLMTFGQAVKQYNAAQVASEGLPMNKNARKPLPAGTMIEFCDHDAEVISDPGGDGRLSVKVDGHEALWYWSFEGAECSVISMPDHHQKPEL